MTQSQVFPLQDTHNFGLEPEARNLPLINIG